MLKNMSKWLLIGLAAMLVVGLGVGAWAVTRSRRYESSVQATWVLGDAMVTNEDGNISVEEYAFVPGEEGKRIEVFVDNVGDSDIYYQEDLVVEVDNPDFTVTGTVTEGIEAVAPGTSENFKIYVDVAEEAEPNPVNFDISLTMSDQQ